MTVFEFRTTLPPRELSPNSRPHWAEKYRAKQDYEREVRIDCLVALDRVGGLAAFGAPWGRARLSLAFGTKARNGDGRYHPDDIDNALASFKAGIDAIVRLHIIAGDTAGQLQMAGVRIDPESYGVTVRIEKEESDD